MTSYADAVTALNALLYTGGRGRITPENMATAIVGVTDALQSSLDEHADIIPVANLTEAAALTGLHAGDIIHVANNGASKWARYQVTSAGDGTWSGASKTLFLTQDQAHTHLVADLSDASAAARTLLQQVDAAAMRTALGLSTVATGALPGAAGLLAGEEGVAFDFLTRTAYVNDYANDLTDSGRPSDLLTVSRASTKMVVGRDRLLASVAANTLAYRHDPVTGAPQGVLVEAAATNLALRSQELDNATWSKTRSTVTANAATAPDGTATADKLVEDTSNGTHFSSQAFSGTTNTSAYTYSRWVQAAGRTEVQLMIIEGATFTRSVSCIFNLTAGTAGTAVTAGGATAGTPKIEAFPGGIYRCSITATLGGSDTSIQTRDYIASAGVTSYTGDGTSGLYLWGAQLETGSYASSYVPTTTTTVTRNADMVSIATSLFPLSATQGTLYVAFERPAIGSSVAFASLNNVFSSNSIALTSGGAAPNSLRADVQTGAVIVAQITLTTVDAANVINRAAVAYRADDFAAVLNGGAVLTDTSGAIPVVTRLTLGGTGVATAAAFIRRVAYFSRRLTDAELIRLTS